MSETPRRLALLGLVVAGTLFGCALWELGLRLAGVGYPSFYRADSDLGTALRPGARGWYTREGRAYVHINRAGLRDRDHDRSKPPRTLRIAVLGDSYAEARQVALDDAFWAVLGRELQACHALSGYEVEPINFGVSGYGTDQELLMLRKRVWAYSPDVVLLAFLPGNDVRDNSKQLRAMTKPYFTLEGGRLVLDDSFRFSSGYRFRSSRFWRVAQRAMDYSRVLQVANEARNGIRRRRMERAAEGLGDRRPGGAMHREVGLDDIGLLEHGGPAWREAWEVTEALVLAMSRDVRERGSDFWVVLLPSGVQVHPDPSVREQLQRDLGLDNLFAAEDRMLRLGERGRFPVIPLARPFRDHAREHGVFLHGFENTRLGTGHWNERGHQLAGEMIARTVCEAPGAYLSSLGLHRARDLPPFQPAR